MSSDLQIGDLVNGKSYKINGPSVSPVDKVGANLSPDAEHIIFLIDSLIRGLTENDAKIIVLE